MSIFKIVFFCKKTILLRFLFSLTNWHIVEIEVTGPNGFSTKTRRENPAAPGAVMPPSLLFF
jgi:hypothetical protein